MHRADCGDKLGRTGIFQHISLDPDGNHPVHIFFAVMHREDEDLALRDCLNQDPRGLQAVHSRHVDIQQDDIGKGALRKRIASWPSPASP